MNDYNSEEVENRTGSYGSLVYEIKYEEVGGITDWAVLKEGVALSLFLLFLIFYRTYAEVLSY